MSSSNNSTNGGRGRGLLVRKLNESTESPKRTENVEDSGVETCSPVVSRNVGGRGRIVEILSSTSTSLSPQEPLKKSGGRARLIQTMSSRSSIPMAMEVSSSSKSAIDEQPKADAPSKHTVETITKSLDEVNINAPIEEPEQLVISKRGTSGKEMMAGTNYIRLRADPETGVFEYEVKFDANIHDMKQRHLLIAQHKAIIGNTKTFDGTTLYLPRKLNENCMKLTCTNELDNGSPTDIVIKFRRKKRLCDCIHLYNVLFTRIFKVLEYVRIGTKDFDPSSPMLIPQHRLEVWPGYVTAVDEYEDGIMLCLDASHRVLCQTTVLEIMKMIYRQDAREYQAKSIARVVGAVVLTRYNNRSYRIDEINFDATPMDTFLLRGEPITYKEYYRRMYNINITDEKQPLLINRESRRIVGKREKEEILFCLVPELCYLTGLTDEMRNDFKVMKDIATFTRISPNQRMEAFKKFVRNVNNNPKAREILANWGLTLESDPLRLCARQLPIEKIKFGNGNCMAGDSADFNRDLTKNQVLTVIPIDHWILIHCRNDQKFAQSFLDCIARNASPMGLSIKRPHVEILDRDTTELYVQALRRLIRPPLQIVVIICPTSRDDRYAAIKKVCCSELPIASQVINARTLKDDAKNRSIVQKIALQMNCKLGGTLWSIEIPLKWTMICGIDSFHDTGRNGNSVSAFVASLNDEYTRWFSQAGIQSKKEEFVNGLRSALCNALNTYRGMNKQLPEKIIIFRDGVGDGQLNVCREYELEQLKGACKLVDPNYNPKFTYIIVQKRINTRIFTMNNKGFENPKPGCVVDHTITRRYLYDFFLIPQSVRQGTVCPTHYIVLEDECNFSPDILQRLSYRLCFLYYNWPGSVRVPACCQYAHKLAYLVGQSIKRQPSDILSDKLFYL